VKLEKREEIRGEGGSCTERYGVVISMTGGVEGAEREGNKGRSHTNIEGNPSTAFAARLIPQYESHIRVTKETIQFVVNLTKEIPHSNRVTKERTPKLSQQVSDQGTVRGRTGGRRTGAKCA